VTPCHATHSRRLRGGSACAAAPCWRLQPSEGAADFLQVLDAERTQLEAEDELAQGRTDAATAYAALYKALGGCWPAEVGS
jgi:outer membrane protein TolC